MPLPLNPLAKDLVDPLTGLPPVGSVVTAPEEVARRVQELFNEWLKFYFSGNPFTTAAAEGGTESKTFDLCDLLFDKAVPKNPADKPMLHLILNARRDGRGRRCGGGRQYFNGRWNWSLMVRTPAQVPTTAAGRAALSGSDQEAARVCRRLAAQASWLLNSLHVAELARKGIGHLVVEDGPKEAPAGGFNLHVLTFSAEVGYHTLLPDP
jgi:hypothetical protein